MQSISPIISYFIFFQLQEYEKSEENLREDKGKDYPFEYFYDKATKERLAQNEAREAEEEDEDEVMKFTMFTFKIQKNYILLSPRRVLGNIQTRKKWQ